jgi:hypothetical protein
VNGVGSTVTTGDGVGVRRGGLVACAVGSPSLGAGVNDSPGDGRRVGTPPTGGGTARMFATSHAVASPPPAATARTITTATTHGSTPRAADLGALRRPSTGGTDEDDGLSRSEGTAAD